MLTEEQLKQFASLINSAKKALISVPEALSPDTAGAALALALFLQKQEKQAEILTGGNFLESYPFLPKFDAVKTALAGVQSLAVVINTSQKPLEEISYSKEAGRAKIFLKSKGEFFTSEDITFETQKAPYDLAIILGAQSLEDLGKVFETNTEVFYDTPKLNIDNHPGNKHFGGLNLVDINASSVCEIVAFLLKEYEAELVDEDISTSLLAGIVARTNSFQHPRVSPASFLAASELVSKGARQQEIVKALFKTKSLGLLKLWGRALAKLKEGTNFALSVLNESDFQKSGAELIQVPLALKEIVENFSGKEFLAILTETTEGVKLFLSGREQIPTQIAEIFTLGKQIKGLLNAPRQLWEFGPIQTSLEEAEAKLTEALNPS